MSPIETRTDDGKSTHGPSLRNVDAGALLAQTLDEEFIEAAYGELFGRPADTDGFLHYRFLLRSGFPRVSALHAMAHSPEGRGKHVVLENMPPAVRLGASQKAFFYLKLQVRLLIWKALERPGELAERRQLEGAAGYWRLVSAALTSQMRRQQELETAIHVWRREMDDRFRRLEAALGEALASRMTSPSGAPPGISAFLDRKLRLGMVVVEAATGAGSTSVAAVPARSDKVDQPMELLAELLAGRANHYLVRAGSEHGRNIVELMLNAAARPPISLLWEISRDEAFSPPIDLIQRAAISGYRICRVSPETGECTPFSAAQTAGPLYLLLESAEAGRKHE